MMRTMPCAPQWPRMEREREEVEPDTTAWALTSNGVVIGRGDDKGWSEARLGQRCGHAAEQHEEELDVPACHWG